MTDLRDFQKPYARDPAEVRGWASGGGAIGLLETVKHAAPTVLLGTSTVHGAFTREVIETMSAGVQRPVVFPISNPTSRIEAMPADAMLLAAAEAVAGQVDVSAPGAPLVPPVNNLRASSATTAVAVARAAMADGVATAKPDNLVQAVQDAMWQPVYDSVTGPAG